MAGDALDLFRAMRPQGPPTPTGDIRAPASNRSRELHGLAMVPGQPGYNERIPRPPCFRCGEDHWPNQSYDHQWEQEPAPVHDEPVSASPAFRRPDVIEQARAQLRAAIYVGRGDMYVVAIESAPDWDSTETYRVNSTELLLMVKLIRSLGIKVADKTGGDLVMLEQEMASAGQYAQNNGRSTESPGSGGPRRSGPPALGPQAGPEDGAEQAP